MSITALVWLTGVGVLSLGSLARAPYGFALYLLTFYLFPAFWWWGDALPNLRWNLAAGIVFALAVGFQAVRNPIDRPHDPATQRIGYILVAIAVNATLVHLLLSRSWAISVENYVLLLKFVVLFFLIVGCIRNPRDLRFALWAIILGAAYIGFEVTVNDRGRFVAGRLEGIGAAGTANANELASLMATILPLAGALFFTGGWRDKLLVAITGPLILNVVLLCNSRGAFLALIGGAVAFLIAATGPARKQAFAGLALAGVATVLLLGDPDITGRFTSTFSDKEERDQSANARLVLWRAGFMMIRDYPLGGGGDGFKAGYGGQYLPAVGVDREGRSVHSGLLNEACEWGLQGFLLRMLFIGLAVQLTRRVMRQSIAAGRPADAALGSCLIASAATFLISCAFGDYLDNEWGYWVPALMVAYARLYGTTSLAGVTDRLVATVPAAGVHGRTSRARRPTPTAA